MQHSKYQSKMGELIKFAYHFFITAPNRYTADCLTFNGKQFSNLLTEDLLQEIEQHILATSDDAYVVIEICFDSYCEVIIDKDLPITNVIFKAVGEHLDLVFKNTDVFFPEECFPVGADTYTIWRRDIKNAGKLNLKQASHLSFMQCRFSSSLKGLKHGPSCLTLVDCTGLATFSGANLTRCSLIHLGYTADNKCELMDLNGLPSTLTAMSIHRISNISNVLSQNPDVYMEVSEDQTVNSIINETGVKYATPAVLAAFSKCACTFDYLFLSIPDDYDGSLLGFFTANVSNLHFEVSVNNKKLTTACLSVSSHVNDKSEKTINRMLDCQEELIELGAAKYAGI